MPWERSTSGCRGCRAFKEALKPGETRLVMLESPTNPRMQICDIRTLARISHEVSQSSTVACGKFTSTSHALCSRSRSCIAMLTMGALS